MLLNGDIEGAETLSPFQEHDGVLVVDSQRVIRYASGIASELYRRLGYQDSLVGRHLGSLETGDQAMYSQVIEDLRCHEDEFQERPYLRGDHQLIWIRKAVPLISYPVGRPVWKPWLWFQRGRVDVLFAIHDATEERRSERERKRQATMVQEVHHRVKNNLQTVAALLRMQMRRSKTEETRAVLKDSVGRILSMAVVHEYLSRADHQAINIREVTQRIIQEIRQGVLSPDKQIRVVLAPGNNLYLPARQATACALVINELLQNAVEHGYAERSEGQIDVQLEDKGDEIEIIISDDGDGLPPDFDLGQTASLGLQIVQTLVQEDLRGALELEDVGGVRATVRFSKQVWEGE
jgi:two-component sensor histidine kinase